MKKEVRFELVMTQGERDSLAHLAMVEDRSMGDVLRRLIRAEAARRRSVMKRVEERSG